MNGPLHGINCGPPFRVLVHQKDTGRDTEHEIELEQRRDDLTARLKALAHKSNVTIVGVRRRSLPSGASYQNWMLQQLDETKCFLSLAADSVLSKVLRFGP